MLVGLQRCKSVWFSEQRTLAKTLQLRPGSGAGNSTAHTDLGWFIWGLGRETGPSGAFEQMAMERLRTEGEVEIKGDIQKQNHSDKSYRGKKN